MGTHQGGNGDNVPPDGGNVPPEDDRSPDDPLELPELPPEWGQIPDDLSALGDEEEQIRQELAARQEQAAHQGREPAGSDQTGPSVGTPLLIMSMAVLITLVSLVAMAWSGSTSPVGGQDGGAGQELPQVLLTDSLGRQVPVAGQAPAAIMLVDGCENCNDLVAATAATAPPGVTVVLVGRTLPDPPTGLDSLDPAPVRLADPNGALRTELDLGPPTNAATVVLADQDRQITRTVEDVTSVGQFQGDLVELGAQ